MSGVKTLVIDANRLSREGLLALLARGELDVVGEASTLEELDTTGPEVGPEALGPELILISCGLDAERAHRDLTQLRARYPAAKTVVLSGNEDPSFMVSCLSAPIDGLISKNVSSAVLLKSLHLVLAGERVFPAQMISTLLTGGANSYTAPGAKIQPDNRALSDREVHILQSLMTGASNKVIANRLNLAEATVKVHLRSIRRKIGVRNRTQAVIWALNNGMKPDMSADQPRSEPIAALGGIPATVAGPLLKPCA